MGTNILRSIVGWPWFDGKMLKDGVRDIVKLRLPEDEKDRLGDDASEALLYLDLDKTVAVESGTPRQGKMYSTSTKENENIGLTDTVGSFAFIEKATTVPSD